MRITWYDFNTFVLESGRMKVFLDPGGTVYRRPRLSPLIPRTIWADAALVAVEMGIPCYPLDPGQPRDLAGTEPRV